MSGKAVRLRRVFPPGGRGLFAVPLDHSVSLGPIDGLENVRPLARELVAGGVDMLIVTPGTVRDVLPELSPSTLLGVHISASTSLGPMPDRKVIVGSAAQALALGADVLSIQVNFGVPEEAEMLSELGAVADQCRTTGLPLIVMSYVKGSAHPSAQQIRHACRATADLGADIVKTSYPGSVEEFRRLISTTPVPVLLGGGERNGDESALLKLVEETHRAGGAGICIGRNLFQRQPLAPLARKVAGILHGTRT